MVVGVDFEPSKARVCTFVSLIYVGTFFSVFHFLKDDIPLFLELFFPLFFSLQKKERVDEWQGCLLVQD